MQVAAVQMLMYPQLSPRSATSLEKTATDMTPSRPVKKCTDAGLCQDIMFPLQQ